MSGLTHLDDAGAAHMVNVGEKTVTQRSARARCSVRMQPATLAKLRESGIAKGDVLSVARIAGIQGAKRCSELIPLCHPLMLESVEVELSLNDALPGVVVEAECRLSAKTGVEMEALTAVTVAALTIYDMCKAVDKSLVITETFLLSKRGGRSGDWHHPLAGEASS
ncbi:cyclic pyranopterin monophosphate synthase MoaC [Chromatocurvus halotolerans]|uniref:Cyclic pyranopterin monophosphate synthase n=1 Tax=Chromatocurvus halotolerans TaxID=1132028 RepID=A0A4R2LG66_9GAMM|nr:cyclic pyranopterin monophosphate synthase MoaC [Chromatocurvus halotolerans]TCO78285.1 cyclic pyranopterin monophosphate synthase subunit MoaC [Chromatocurvus halotolerans]